MFCSPEHFHGGNISSTDEDECAVCLRRIDDDDEISELRCNHVCHRNCLDVWLECRHTTCPVCYDNLLAPPKVGHGSHGIGIQELVFFDFCRVDSNSDYDDIPSPGSRPPAVRDNAKRIVRHNEDHEKKMKQRDDIVAKLDAHLSSVDEKKSMKRRQLELQEETQEGTILLNHLSILEKNGLEDQDREIVATAKNKSHDIPSPGSRPPAGRDNAKRIVRHNEDHEKKMKQRDDIVAKLDAHLSSVDEKKSMKRRQLELQEETQEGTILLNHLSILEKNGHEDQDREIVATAKNKSHDIPSPGSRPPAGRDNAKRIVRHNEDHEKKMKQRDDIVAKLDAHLSSVDEKKSMKRRQLELQEETQEGTILLNHLSILEKNGHEDQDREIVATAKNKSRSWISKFLS
ncbi:hypothetical protein LXL04_031602 [Taraxacum kok-saghyz]